MRWKKRPGHRGSRGIGRAIVLELARYGTHVLFTYQSNVVSPGVTDTDGLVAPKEIIDGLVAQTPLGRLGQPEDVARAVLLLCTREAAWVTGQNLGANGGILWAGRQLLP